MDLSKLKKWSTPDQPGDARTELPAGQTPVEAPITHALPPAPAMPEPRRAEPQYERRIPEYAPAAPVTAGFGVFLSLILGVLFMFLGQRFARWAIAAMSGQPFSTDTTWMTGPNAGQQVPYWELAYSAAWTDMGIFTMGAALILDALVMFLATRGARPNAILMLIAFVVTGAAVAVNLGLCGKLMVGPNASLPVFSLVAVIAGSFVLFDHWAVWRENAPAKRGA